MPLSPAQRRKISGQKIENAISLSNTDKKARSTAKKEKAEVDKDESEIGVPAWAITILAVVVFGSVLAQLYFTIVNSPTQFGEAGAADAGESQ